MSVTCDALTVSTVIDNGSTLLWIAFQMILFSMPTTLPVTAISMNYASVVFAGFFALSTIYYIVWARKGESGHHCTQITCKLTCPSFSLRGASKIRWSLRSMRWSGGFPMFNSKSGVEIIHHHESVCVCAFHSTFDMDLKLCDGFQAWYLSQHSPCWSRVREILVNMSSIVRNSIVLTCFTVSSLRIGD